ncbi:MAG TPA: magnesium transporter, partial [Dehalococcoidia bacterium]|nr:magnesium transporter [Dehalococcoidia bacterium]
MTLDLTLSEGGPPDCAALAEPAIIVSPRASAGEALAHVKEAGPGVAYVAVAGDEGFRGLVSVASLVSADPSAMVGDLAVMPAAAVPGETSAERAAWLAAHAGEDIVAVLDADGRLQGLIPGHRLLGLMMREHEVDLARLGGFLRGTSRARTASEEGIGRRVWHRLPWLLLGLAGAVVAARIVSAFEDSLEDTVALAFFLPGIVYMADAVGTQTETLVIRGLSVGVAVRRIFRLEFLTGAVIGALLSLAIFPLAVL